jgi:hypothetical protein
MCASDSFLKENQKSYFLVSKNSEKDQDVASEVYHKLANYQLEIMCILSYTKRQKCES